MGRRLRCPPHPRPVESHGHFRSVPGAQSRPEGRRDPSAGGPLRPMRVSTADVSPASRVALSPKEGCPDFMRTVPFRV